MNKKKTLKKQDYSFDDIPCIKLHNEANFEVEKPQDFFKDHKIVAEALLQCLVDNDAESFMDILEAYLRINKSQIAESSGISRSTIKLAFSKKGNPTIKTIAKIVHEAIALNK